MKFNDVVSTNINAFEKQIRQKYGIKTFMISTGTAGAIELSMIEIEKGMRKQGIGTSVMEDLIAFADKNKRKIILHVGQADDKHGTTSRNRLVKFYKRFGFVENKGRKKDFQFSHGMYRDPK